MPKPLLVILFWMSMYSYAQFEWDDHSLMLSGQTMQLSEDIYSEVGVKYDYQFADRWTVGYSFGIGRRAEDNQGYLHLTGGMALPALLWSRLVEEGNGLALTLVGTAFLPFIPEKVSYDFFASDKTIKISPFLRVLSFDFANVYHSFEYNFFYRFGLGSDIRFIDKTNRWLLGGTVSYRQTLDTVDGINIGVQAGMMLNKKTSRKNELDKYQLNYD